MMKIEPHLGEPLEPDPIEERMSWAAYFGAAAGLIAGLVVAMLLSAWIYHTWPEEEYGEMFWQIASPLLAVLGLVGLGLGFHRYLRGQIALPAILFFGLLALGAWLAMGHMGFPWMIQPEP